MRRLSFCSTVFVPIASHQDATATDSFLLLLAFDMPETHWGLRLRSRFSGRDVHLAEYGLGSESPAFPWPPLTTNVYQTSNR
jgi:hypothetical protein